MRETRESNGHQQRTRLRPRTHFFEILFAPFSTTRAPKRRHPPCSSRCRASPTLPHSPTPGRPLRTRTALHSRHTHHPGEDPQHGSNFPVPVLFPLCCFPASLSRSLADSLPLASTRVRCCGLGCLGRLADESTKATRTLLIPCRTFSLIRRILGSPRIELEAARTHSIFSAKLFFYLFIPEKRSPASVRLIVGRTK